MSLFNLALYTTIYYLFGCSITFNIILFNLLLNNTDNSNNPFINIIQLFYKLSNLSIQIILLKLSNNIIGKPILSIYDYLNSKYLSIITIPFNYFTPKPIINSGLNNTKKINSFLDNLDNMT